MKKTWLYIGSVALIYLVLIMISSLLNIGEQLSRIHYSLEIIFHVLSVYLLWTTIVRHVVKVIFTKENKPVNFKEYSGSLRKKTVDSELIRLSKLKIFEKGLPKVENDEEKLLRCYEVIDDVCVDIINTRAKNVFLTTAFSQNGKLDAIFILINQVKLISELVEVQRTRTNIKDLYKIYSNIILNSISADLLSEADLSTYIMSIMSSTSISNIPGASVTGAIVARSVLEGSANSILTLRVGYLTLEILKGENLSEKNRLRSSATSKAMKHFPGLLVGVVKLFTSAITGSITSKVKDMGEGIWDTGVNAAETVTETITDTGEKIKDAANTTIDAITDTTDKGIKTVSETGETLLNETLKGADYVIEKSSYVYEQGKDSVIKTPEIIKSFSKEITSQFGKLFKSNKDDIK